MIDQRPTVVCAWCSRLLEEGSTLVSHGICTECMHALIADNRPVATTFIPGSHRLVATR